MLGGGTYVAYTLNLLGPMLQMANAATNQGVEIGKQKLREFIENSDTARQALAMPARERDSDSVSLDTLDSRGRRKQQQQDDDDI
jgi:protein SEY1